MLSVFLYPIVFFYFTFLSFLGGRSNKIQVGILYEEWNPIGAHFKLFYSPIYERLLNRYSNG